MLFHHAILALLPFTFAAPAPDRRTTGAITNNSQLAAAIKDIANDIANGIQPGTAFANVISRIVPQGTPNSIFDALRRVAQGYNANPNDLLTQAAALILNGVVPKDFLTLINAFTVENNQNNVNPREPSTQIYPKKDASDAPYDLPEAELRSKIYIPPNFTYGQKTPVIFIPGTGTLAGFTFGTNYGKLLADSPLADPVYLNIPNFSLNDIQSNAEYVAYAINYISGISSNVKVVTIGWSQSSLSVRWANKYWPSTRPAVQFAHQVSADFHGTIFANLLCLALSEIGCAPAVLQQEYNSTFVATLRNNGGDSAYDPLNSAYSAFDEVVQPQEGVIASAFSNDARGVGVSNIYLQDYCGVFLPGGTIYNTHEGVLYNALAFAAATQSLQTGRNADLSRINVLAECLKLATDGLTLADVLATEANIPIAAFTVLAANNKMMVEPRIKDYARKDIPAGYFG